MLSDSHVRAASCIHEPRFLAAVACLLLPALFGCSGGLQVVDQATLARIAVEEDDAAARWVAIGELVFKESVDQDVLTRVAFETDYEEVRHAAFARLTDRALVAAIALEEQDASIRLAAVSSLEDQALLKKIAIGDEDGDVRLAALARITDEVALGSLLAAWRGNCGANLTRGYHLSAVANLTDQAILQQLAADLEACYTIRAAAIEALTDEAFVARIEAGSRPPPGGLNTMRYMGVRNAARDRLGELRRNPSHEPSYIAVKRMSDQAMLAEVALGGLSGRRARYIAVQMLTDQVLLAEVALGVTSGRIQHTAINKLKDPAALARIALVYGSEARARSRVERAMALTGLPHGELLIALADFENHPMIRTTAVLLINDQETLRRIAEADPTAVVRRAAVVGVADDEFLLKLVDRDSSPTVRNAVVRTLHDMETVLRASGDAYHGDVRAAALNRLIAEESGQVLERARAAQRGLERQTAELRSSTDTSMLTDQALGGRTDEHRRAAAETLRAPADFVHVAKTSLDRGVLKTLLDRLDGDPELNELADTAADPAVRIAAAIKTGRVSWSSVFQAASGPDGSPRALGDALAAVALFSEARQDARAGVQEASLNLIGLGDESRIPEMVDILGLYGDRQLGEDYLNCGQPDLAAAGRDWALKRGYQINTGEGSHRASWRRGR